MVNFTREYSGKANMTKQKTSGGKQFTWKNHKITSLPHGLDLRRFNLKINANKLRWKTKL